MPTHLYQPQVHHDKRVTLSPPYLGVTFDLLSTYKSVRRNYKSYTVNFVILKSIDFFNVCKLQLLSSNVYKKQLLNFQTHWLIGF